MFKKRKLKENVSFVEKHRLCLYYRLPLTEFINDSDINTVMGINYSKSSLGP